MKKFLFVVFAVVLLSGALASSASLAFAADSCSEDKLVDLVVVMSADAFGDGDGNIETNGGNFGDRIWDLFNEAIGREDVTLNASLVAYGKGSMEIFGLTPVDEITEDFAEERVAESSSWIGSHRGIHNLESGMLLAKDILENSTTGATNENKHVILLTDGAVSLYNNANAESANQLFYNGMYMSISNMDSNSELGSIGHTSMVQRYIANNDGDYAAAFAAFRAENGDIDAIADSSYKYGVFGSSSDEGAEIAALENAGKLKVYRNGHVNFNNLEEYPYTSMEIGAYRASGAMQGMADKGFKLHTVGYDYAWGSDLPILGDVSKAFLMWTGNIGDAYIYDGKVISDAFLDETLADLTTRILGEIVPCEEDIVNPDTFGNDSIGFVAVILMFGVFCIVRSVKSARR